MFSLLLKELIFDLYLCKLTETVKSVAKLQNDIRQDIRALTKKTTSMKARDDVAEVLCLKKEIKEKDDKISSLSNEKIKLQNHLKKLTEIKFKCSN